MKAIISFLFVAWFLMGDWAVAQSDDGYFSWMNGNRKGFLAGIYLGYSNVSYSNGSTQSGSGFSAGANFGSGVGENLLICFRYRYTYADLDMLFHTFAWTGDAMFFPRKGFPFCINVGLGPTLVVPEFGVSKSGTVFYIGAGYEVTKHMILLIDYGTASVDNLTGNSLNIGLNVLAY